MRFRRFAVAILIFGMYSSASASTPIDAREYIKLRKQYATMLPVDTLKAEPSSYVGKYFEIRGSIAGVSKNQTGGNVIISVKDGASYVVNTDLLPCENPGMEVACLVRIEKGSVYSLSDLKLVACTYEADIQRIEQQSHKPAPAKPAQEQQPKPTAKPQEKPNEAVQTGSEDMVRTYKNAVKQFNSKLTDNQADTIARSVIGFSARYQVDPRLVCAVILAESNFRVTATSRAGAMGLGQLMPGTAAGLGVNNAYDPVENVYGSVRYIRSMLDRMSGNKHWNQLTWNDLAKALAAYNAGPGAVKKHGGIPPYKETQNYVRRVVAIYKQLCGVK